MPTSQVCLSLSQTSCDWSSQAANQTCGALPALLSSHTAYINLEIPQHSTLSINGIPLRHQQNVYLDRPMIAGCSPDHRDRIRLEVDQCVQIQIKSSKLVRCNEHVANPPITPIPYSIAQWIDNLIISEGLTVGQDCSLPQWAASTPNLSSNKFCEVVEFISRNIGLSWKQKPPLGD